MLRLCGESDHLWRIVGLFEALQRQSKLYANGFAVFKGKAVAVADLFVLRCDATKPVHRLFHPDLYMLFKLCD